MNYQDKDNPLSQFRYTVVYYRFCSDLEIGIEEMTILNTMLRFSKRNEFTKDVTFLAKYLCMSRTTIYKYIEKLAAKNHIYLENGTYCLNADIKSRFEFYKQTPDEKYIKIYHGHRKKLGLSILEYCLLYLYYSLSTTKKNQAKRAYASCKYYMENLGIKERTYYDIKQKFKAQNLILNEDSFQVKLTPNIFAWFADRGNHSNK